MDLPALGDAAFNFQGQKLLLTYKGQLPKEELMASVRASSGIKDPKFIRVAHETGDDRHPYPHCHLVVDFGKIWKCRNCRRLDFHSEDGVSHPNWHPIKTATHFRNAKAYLAKEDPDNADLLETSPNVIAAIWAQPTLGEALLNCANAPSQVPGIIAAYAARPGPEVVVKPPSHPWQLEVLDLIDSPPDTRTIHWFYDPVGNTGKTWLARYLLANKLAYMVKQCGGSYHFATIMANAIASGWDQRAIVFDLARSSEDHAIYAPIEEVKDGVVTALKYQGGTLLFNQPHVLVFANFMPKVEALSLDRWQMHKICHTSLTLDKACVATPQPTNRPDNVAPNTNLNNEDVDSILADFI